MVLISIIAILPTNKEQHVDNIFGLDWGQSWEPVCIAVVSRERKLLDIKREIVGGYAAKRDVLRGMYSKWNPVQMWAEQASIGDPNIEALQSEGMPIYPFSTYRANLNIIINKLGEAVALDHFGDAFPLLGEQLNKGWWNQTPQGVLKWEQDRSVGNDVVIAAALALYAVSLPGVKLNRSFL
jgi:hypothetical protein